MERLSYSKGERVHPGFRPVPRTGVIYVMTEAAKRGYSAGATDWANLGQGAPEINPLPGAPARITKIDIDPIDHEYAPIDGLPELRDAVAALYNERYRKDKKSKYTRENVAISGGGRVAVTRTISSIGRTNIGHFLPDYTAYEELLDAFSSFVPIPILLDVKRGYSFTSEDLKNEILGRGLSALLLSNPCNPTGKLVHGSELEEWVSAATALRCTLIFDEFYSHYVYDTGKLSISAAEFVEDVNEDPIVIIDGLTKNWRYPGFRVAWTVAPKEIIEGITSAGSFLDGGCPRPMQRTALSLVTKDVADKEAAAIQKEFSKKRAFLVGELESLGVKAIPAPEGCFYCWGNLSSLPQELNEGMKLFKEALTHKVITVPGAFFDINPGQRRPERESRFAHYARFSFGPSMEELERGVSGLKKTVGAFK